MADEGSVGSDIDMVEGHSSAGGRSQKRSARWSPTQEIGWSSTQEIRWSPTQEIEWSSTEEILHRASSPIATTPSAAFLARSVGRTVNCSLQGQDGRTLVVSMDPKDQSHGGFLMPNISVWPNDASVCSLWQVVVKTSIPARYFLSPRACAGISRRARRRGKALPPLLKQALVTQAMTGKSRGAPMVKRR